MSNSTHTTCSFNKISSYALINEESTMNNVEVFSIETSQSTVLNILLSISLFFLCAISTTYIVFRLFCRFI